MGWRASLSTQRSTLMHAATICDDPEIQQLLPQVFLVGEQQLSAERTQAVRGGAPVCAHIWRCKEAWMSPTLMKKCVLLLGRCLGA